MSAIWGILNLDGSPVDRGKLADMKSAMAYWGPDGSGVWQEGPVGLGHLLLFNTPESLHETQPLQSDSGDLVITAEGRIDNREELFDALGVPHPERAVTPDGTLILKAYEKWGQDCPDRLLGDWSFAVWDRQERKLFLARDHDGNTGIYYYRDDRFFVFASSFKGLFALPEIPQRLNEWPIVQILTSWPPAGDATCYQDIHRLPPAHFVTVTAERTDVRRYWFLEEAPEVRLGSAQEYVEAFLDVYSEAVRCRLRSHRPVGVTLSGGLDSGSVTGLAARQLAAQGKRLPAFSSVPLYDVDGLMGRSCFENEKPFMDATAGFAGNVDIHYIRAQDVSPLAGIERYLFLHDEPGHAASNSYWIMALIQEAQSQGIGTLLTGQKGNATVSWTGLRPPPGPLWELVRERGLWPAIKRYLSRSVLPDSWVGRYKRWRAGREPWRKYSAINMEWTRQHDLMGRMLQAGHDPWFQSRMDPRETRCAIIRPGQNKLGAIWAEAGAGYGMEVRDPTMDKRLMTFCLGVPEEQYVRDGWDRSLIRRAMYGIIPEKVQWNRMRGRQAADIGYRLLDNWDEVRTAVESLQQSDMARRYLDIPRMRDVLASLKKGINRSNTGECGSILLRGLGVGLFLRQFDDGLSGRVK